ncbi:hypothetical protein [Telluribacter humicola]|jgi:hypothetical protein|uniref:hypothetical protein n=1 Tax=Telluribacter humicola TaxID=1720261 RepID=UPI001A964725|nr:hypothetical protein [Telluribacter humicola]
MLQLVRYVSDHESLEVSTFVIADMLFHVDPSGQIFCPFCDRTVADYGLSPEQFRHMIELEGLKTMLDYYPDAFLFLGQNRYIFCELVKSKQEVVV